MSYRSRPTGASRLVLPCNRGISENTNLKTHLIWARPQIAIPPCCINCLRFCSARRFLSSSAIAWISAAAGLPLVGRRLVLRPDGLAVWRRSAVGLPDVCAWDVCASFCASDVCASLSASPSTSLFLSLSRDTNAAAAGQAPDSPLETELVIAAGRVVEVAGLVMGVAEVAIGFPYTAVMGGVEVAMGFVEVAGLVIDAHAAAVAASSGLGAPVAFNCVFDGDGIE
jgi:hypothetical protein